ncbi:MAG: sialidase family protein, partial [Candidatus Hydrogenedentes bacterium]|nr:sialidase family protein [Candidatus Hydrogenedentota bacterium]
MRVTLILFITIMLIGVTFAESTPELNHGIVYLEEDRFAGWPANNGIWSWDDEIVVGFTLGYYKRKIGGHPIDPDRPSAARQARSLDGGDTWTLELPSYLLDEAGSQRPAREPEGDIDFTHPDFAARFRGDVFYYSYDRCRTWAGPYSL